MESSDPNDLIPFETIFKFKFNSHFIFKPQPQSQKHKI